MVKPQEVEAVGAVPEVHNPGLVRMQAQLECLGGSLEPVGTLRVGLGPTQDHGIIRVADDAPEVGGLLRRGPRPKSRCWLTHQLGPPIPFNYLEMEPIGKPHC